MEALSGMLKRVVEGNFISGCRFSGRDRRDIVISHLLYGDDTIMFCETNSEQLMYLRWTLMWFEAFSGLKINLMKSVIIPLGRVDNVEELAAELGCGVGSLPSTYLGLPLGTPHRALGVWDSPSKTDLEEGWQPGKDSISQRGGGSHSFGVLCLAFPFTFFLCSECRRLFVLGWRRFRETFFGVGAI